VNGAMPVCAVIVRLYGVPVTAFGSVAGASGMGVFWMRRFAATPAATANGAGAQVRAFTRVTVIAPMPSAPIDLRSIVNNVPPTVGPHGAPTRFTSTVYAPPPSSVTLRLVFVKPSNQEPR